VREFPFTVSASVTLGGFNGGSGTVTGPAAFQVIATAVPVAVAGTYTVTWSLSLAGTLGGNDAFNMRLVKNGSVFIAGSDLGGAGTHQEPPVTLTLAAGDVLTVTAGPNNATAGAVYSATIDTIPGNGTAQAGPSFPRESWDVAVASVSASSNAKEAVCKIYAGPQAAQAWFADGTTWGSTGDSTSNFSAPVYLGSSVFAVWTGGDPGATATLVVTGTRRIP